MKFKKYLILFAATATMLCSFGAEAKNLTDDAEIEKLPKSIQNGSFEEPSGIYDKLGMSFGAESHTKKPIRPTVAKLNEESGGSYYWKTTACNDEIGIWKSSYTDKWKAAKDGGYFVEINSREQATLYQNIRTYPGSKLKWGVTHAAHVNQIYDTMALIIGPAQTDESIKKTGEKVTDDVFCTMVEWLKAKETDLAWAHGVTNKKNQYTVYSKDLVHGMKASDENFTLDANNADYPNEWKITFFTDNDRKWYNYGLNYDESKAHIEGSEYDIEPSNYEYEYTVPKGQNATMFAFVAVVGHDNDHKATNVDGNFIDDVRFGATYPLEVSTTSGGSGNVTVSGKTAAAVTHSDPYYGYAIPGEKVSVKATAADGYQFIGVLNGKTFIGVNDKNNLDDGEITKEKDGKTYTYTFTVEESEFIKLVFSKDSTVIYDPNGGRLVWKGESAADFNIASALGIPEYEPVISETGADEDGVNIGADDNEIIASELEDGNEDVSVDRDEPEQESFYGDDLVGASDYDDNTYIAATSLDVTYEKNQTAEINMSASASAEENSVSEYQNYFEAEAADSGMKFKHWRLTNLSDTAVPVDHTVTYNTNTTDDSSDDTLDVTYNGIVNSISVIKSNGIVFVAEWKYEQKVIPVIGGMSRDTTEDSTGGTVTIVNKTDTSETSYGKGGGALSVFGSDGDEILVRAKANDGYTLLGWYDKEGVCLSKSDEYSYDASGKGTVYARFTKLYKPYLSFVSQDAISSESAASDDENEVLSVSNTPFKIGSHNVNSDGNVVITGETGGEKYGNTISTGFVGTIEGTLDEVGKYKNIVWSISVPVGEDVKTDVTEAVGKSRALADNETVSVLRGATYLKVSGNTNDYSFELQKTELTDNASYNAGTICKSLDGSEREISVYDSLPIMSGDAKITISIGVILDDIYAPDATATLSLTSATAVSGAIDVSEDDRFDSSRYGYFHVDKDSVFGASEKNPYVNRVQTKEE